MPRNSTNRASEEIGPIAHAVPRSQISQESISFKELYADSYKYIVRPKYQRDNVWNLRQKQQFIDSLFLGDPFSPVEGYESFFTEGEHIGEKYWEIGDGQNRIHAILEFRADGFKTWTARQKRAYEPNSQVGPVSPGKLYSELDQLTKNYWESYRIRIDPLRDRPEVERATRFLRVQNHVPLTAAEKLRVYSSKAKDAARRIEQHSFWTDFYEGKTNQGQLFQSSLYLLAVEMTPSGIVGFEREGFIQSLISGKHDGKINDALVEDVLERLNIVSHVFAGASFTIRATAVVMYQAVMFLEQAGYKVQPNDKARLKNWIDILLNESRRDSGVPSYNKPLQRLTSKRNQEVFWNKHRAPVFAQFGVNEKQPSPRDAKYERLRQEYEQAIGLSQVGS